MWGYLLIRSSTMDKNTRREFLKKTTTTSLAIGAIAMVGCGDSKGNSRIEKKFAKNEILYNGNTKYWKEYYSTAR